MLGYVFPFFIGNKELGESYYVYKFNSPGLNEKLDPLMSLEKIGEKITHGFCAEINAAGKVSMNGSDLIASIIHTKKNIEEDAVEFINKNVIFRSIDKSFKVYKNGTDFPLIDLDITGQLQKSLILTLRDSIRWGTYRLTAGNYVDAITRKDIYTVFYIDGNQDEISLIPKKSYKITDYRMDNPMDPFDDEKFSYPKTIYKGKNKSSDLNVDLRKLEWRILTF